MIRANTDQIHAFVFFNTCLCFSIRALANTDANTFTKTTSPTQSNTYQYNLKYRPIKVAIQTNAHTIVFTGNTCTSRCQYRHWYCQITRPRQHRQHPLLPICQRYLSLPSRIHPLQKGQPHPLDRRQTVVPRCFVTSKLSTPPRNPRVPIRQNDSGNFLFKD